MRMRAGLPVYGIASGLQTWEEKGVGRLSVFFHSIIGNQSFEGIWVVDYFHFDGTIT